MITARIARAARTRGLAALALATGLGLATPVMSPAIGTAQPGTLYGDPAAAAPFWRYQKYDDDCVEAAAADVVGELSGDEPSEQAIIAVAQATPSTVHSGPIYTKPKKRKAGEGTSFDDAPALLAHYGIHAVSTDKPSAKKIGVPTGMEALEQDLAQGRKVIAGVNAELLWATPSRTKPRTANPIPTTPSW